MGIEVVAVADRARVSLGLALNLLVSKRTSPDCSFNVALPEDSDFGSELAEKIIKEHARSIYKIPAPTLNVEGKLFRIENKINALRAFGNSPAILVDSDVLFVRPLPSEFLIRKVPTAVPEHGKHEFPWERLYSTVGLETPEMTVLTGSGKTCLPWFNAGFVACPSAERMGEVWRMLCEYVSRCEWVPKRWPYTDQIALPLAIAQLSPAKTVTHENVLPASFNQNMFYWNRAHGQLASGFVCHHHNYVGLLRQFDKGNQEPPKAKEPGELQSGAP